MMFEDEDAPPPLDGMDSVEVVSMRMEKVVTVKEDASSRGAVAGTAGTSSSSSPSPSSSLSVAARGGSSGDRKSKGVRLEELNDGGEDDDDDEFEWSGVTRKTGPDPAVNSAPGGSGSAKSGGLKKKPKKPAQGLKGGFFGPGKKQGRVDEDGVIHLKGNKAEQAKKVPDWFRPAEDGSAELPKIKAQLEKVMAPNADVISSVMKNESLMSGFDDPEVMAAVTEIAANPEAIRKYANNKKVTDFYAAMGGLMGQRLEQEAKKQ